MSEQMHLRCVILSERERMIIQRAMYQEAMARERHEIMAAATRDILAAILAAHGLDGQWRVADDLSALVRVNGETGA
jgi:hypothetical protein